MDEDASAVAGRQIRMVGRVGKDLFRLAADLLQLRLDQLADRVVHDVLDLVGRHVLQRLADVPVFDLLAVLVAMPCAACCSWFLRAAPR